MEDQQGACAGGPGVQEIFGVAQGSRVMLRRIMAQGVFRMIASKRPDAAGILEALDGQTCTVTIANHDVFELRLDEPITIQSVYDNVTVTLAHNGNGLFQLSLSGIGEPPLLLKIENIHLRLEDGGFVLADKQPRLKVTSIRGDFKIEVYTAPFLARESPLIRAFAPEMIEAFNLSVLENASSDPPQNTSTAEEEQKV